MGLMDLFRRKPMWKEEQERRMRYEQRSAQLGYKLASASRQLKLAEREAEVARMRKRAERLVPKQRAQSGLAAFNPENVAAALDYNPFGPPKRTAKPHKRKSEWGW